MIAPAMLLLGAVVLYPLGYSLWLSLHDWTLLTFTAGPPFVGLGNYVDALTQAGFWKALRTTVVFIALAVPVEFLFGFAMALLLNRPWRARGALLTLILLPFTVTNVVIGLTFKLLYNYDWGVVNYLLESAALPRVNWLGSLSGAMAGVVLADVWNTSSFFALVLYAGLVALPAEPLEAARVDGASRWQVLRHVVVPLLRPVIGVALLWRFIDTFRIFDVIYVLTGGGPAEATEVISIYAFKNGFRFFRLGFASAVSYLMTAVMLLVAFVYLRRGAPEGESG